MQKRISTVIDGVPVVFELLSVGPASPEAITNFEQNISKEVSVSQNLSISTEEGKLQVIQVGDVGSPANPEEIEKVKKAINTGNINVAELMDRINQIEEAVNSSTDGKPWWASRTIISNLAFIVVAGAAIFGFQIQISEDVITLVFMALSLLNIWIRKTSKSSPISRQILPAKKA